ncbi:hypothetical protein EG829_12725, partial [bacterium]|nr:hypothetical protein [bacterium]
MKGPGPILIIAAALLVFTTSWNSTSLHAAGGGKNGQTVRKTTPNRENPGHVQPVKAGRMSVKPGDLVSLRVTLRLKDGALVFTTEAGIAEKERRAAGYLEPDCHIPLTMLAGDSGPVPGLKEVLAGMHAGERKTVVLSPEKAFGKVDETRIRKYDRIRTLDMVQRMKPSDFTLMTGQEPVTGKEFNINPYFPSKVVAVTDQEVILENLAGDVSEEQGPMGRTTVQVKGDKIQITLTPVIGSDFEVIGMKGKISSYDAATFSVNFNSPLAGREIVLTAEVVSLTPKADLDAEKLPWIEDYQKGLAAAKKSGKPAVVVLYASWCQWSRKFNEEVLSDPRIKSMKDRFV